MPSGTSEQNAIPPRRSKRLESTSKPQMAPHTVEKREARRKKEPKKSNKSRTLAKKKKKEEKTEDAYIERILDERGGDVGDEPKATKNGRKSKRKKVPHQYLCSWVDGAEPQWVDASYLEGTPALEEWEDAEDEEEETHDPPDLVESKCAELCEWLKTAKRPTFLLGAGISAPVLATFRGKAGLWTKNAHENPLAEVTASTAQPTKAHRALAVLERNGYVNWVATQNYDDLSARSGFPTSKLSELHGNIFTETCSKCARVYHRDYEVPLDDSVDHETGRRCDDDKCGGDLRDNIIHFEESLPWHELKMSNCKFVGSDLSIVLGSSLKVEPAASLPFKSKRRSRSLNAKAVIINLQATPSDDAADLIIRATCDEVMDSVAKALVGESWDR
uniref:protein acetyllysine N-acetyltransferase n=1 Tax=Helicotheca tamesis TaxID=374047 RepID=A0A7S2MLZ1_9STRA|mmetsp:Transcript_18154/g.24982  ORF Transcript_18154/g.24982 Transcript_18154/m.24982 type:complete len:389 (+) Transcript_18154:151-1317(+)|eukprot:CAMPEP_0185733838 /NCGR_PEP_ID=MMETSP1171-20130828/20681_1 /TAXON_ID=374046 /ORGANISM="Helicotheca tamensis, Strain CCMP826" /LENGTH=388 /DNA_ID=CAMNT_0028403665 /DNA_START=65 /DNA_END=1231 /DNA_ORIENTATION=+